MTLPLLVLHNIAFAAGRTCVKLLAGCSHYVISELEQWRDRISEDLRISGSEEQSVRSLGNFDFEATLEFRKTSDLGIQHLVKSFLCPRIL